MIERLFTVPEVASTLRISKTNVYALVRTKRIKYVRLTESTIRIPESAIEDYVRSHTVAYDEDDPLDFAKEIESVCRRDSTQSQETENAKPQ